MSILERSNLPPPPAWSKPRSDRLRVITAGRVGNMDARLGTSGFDVVAVAETEDALIDAVSAGEADAILVEADLCDSLERVRDLAPDALLIVVGDHTPAGALGRIEPGVSGTVMAGLLHALVAEGVGAAAVWGFVPALGRRGVLQVPQRISGWLLSAKADLVREYAANAFRDHAELVTAASTVAVTISASLVLAVGAARTHERLHERSERVHVPASAVERAPQYPTDAVFLTTPTPAYGPSGNEDEPSGRLGPNRGESRADGRSVGEIANAGADDLGEIANAGADDLGESEDAGDDGESEDADELGEIANAGDDGVGESEDAGDDGVGESEDAGDDGESKGESHGDDGRQGREPRRRSRQGRPGGRRSRQGRPGGRRSRQGRPGGRRSRQGRPGRRRSRQGRPGRRPERRGRSGRRPERRRRPGRRPERRRRPGRRRAGRRGGYCDGPHDLGVESSDWSRPDVLASGHVLRGDGAAPRSTPRRARPPSPRRAAPRPMLPDFERADRIGEFWGYSESRAFAELPIDCEEDRTLRAVLVGMLREAD